jgi:hypothetical protein
VSEWSDEWVKAYRADLFLPKEVLRYEPAGVVPGSKTYVAELRPSAEHAGKPLHWVRHPTGTEMVAQWDNEEGTWEFHGVSHRYNPATDLLPGYRYLGPAEWREPRPLVVQHTDHVWREQAQARIAELEAEVARVRSASDEVLQFAANRIAELEGYSAACAAAIDQARAAGFMAPPPLAAPATDATHATPFPAKAMR